MLGGSRRCSRLSIYSSMKATRQLPATNRSRPALCEEGTRLGRIVAELMPSEPEVHGLVSLMEIQSSRLRARVGPAGEPIVLLEQNRCFGITCSFSGPGRARACRRARRRTRPLSASGFDHCLSCPAQRRQRRIGPVLRRFTRLSLRSLFTHCGAQSCGRNGHGIRSCCGARVGRCADQWSRRSRNTICYRRCRGDLLAKLGKLAEARVEFERAAGLTRNVREPGITAGASEGMWGQLVQSIWSRRASHVSGGKVAVNSPTNVGGSP